MARNNVVSIFLGASEFCRGELREPPPPPNYAHAFELDSEDLVKTKSQVWSIYLLNGLISTKKKKKSAQISNWDLYNDDKQFESQINWHRYTDLGQNKYLEK